jgi:hypothetical protein
MTSKSTAIITELLQKSIGREEEPAFTLAGCDFSSHLCAPIILLWAPDVPAVFSELQVPVFRLAHSLFPPSDPSPEKCPNREHYDESRVPQMLANYHNRNKALELLYRLPKPGCSHGEIRYIQQKGQLNFLHANHEFSEVDARFNKDHISKVHLSAASTASNCTTTVPQKPCNMQQNKKEKQHQSDHQMTPNKARP